MAKRPHRGEETTPEPAGEAPGARAGREAECRGTLEALNAQFASWVARRAVEHPLTSWRRGCEDYLKHLDSIKGTFRDVLETDAADAADGATAKPAATTATAIAGGANPFGGGGSIFGAANSGGGSLFATAPPAGSIFGALPVAPGGGVGAVAGGAKGEDEDDEDEPPRPSSPSYKANEATEDEHETVLLRVGKVKFHTKKDASEPNWADRGVNSFEFRREKSPGEGGVNRCRVLMRNTIGKAVLNAGLYAKMSATLTEKNNKDGSKTANGLMFTAFNAEEDNQKTLVYLRFGKESDAKELHKLITEHVAKM